MFLPPKIWGCKYTNYFLFINKKPVFQHFGLLITAASLLSFIHLFLSGCCSNLTFHHHPTDGRSLRQKMPVGVENEGERHEIGTDGQCR